jgi:hypothetical protein
MDIANEFEKFRFLNMNDEETLKVISANREMKGSLTYTMINNPRGKGIIINNEPKLFKESKRLENIFKQLYFDLEPVENTMEMSAESIRNKLKSMALETSCTEQNALLIMIISHGENENIFGFDACPELDNNERNEKNIISISEIVDIFSEKNCRSLIYLPKILFFDCFKKSNILFRRKKFL